MKVYLVKLFAKFYETFHFVSFLVSVYILSLLQLRLSCTLKLKHKSRMYLSCIKVQIFKRIARRAISLYIPILPRYIYAHLTFILPSRSKLEYSNEIALSPRFLSWNNISVQKVYIDLVEIAIF